MDPAEACDLEKRYAASLHLLKELVGLPLAATPSAEHISHLGIATHTFSHIQHTMYIDRLTLKVYLASHIAHCVSVHDDSPGQHVFTSQIVTTAFLLAIDQSRHKV